MIFSSRIQSNCGMCTRYSLRKSSSFITALTNSIQELPLREAVRYNKKNMKWTAGQFQDYYNSHANALIDIGFKKSDTVALWLKDSAEKHTTLLASLKIGMKVADVEPNINAVKDIREFLKVSNCKAIFFDPVTEIQDNLLLLRKAIPEFYEYDDTHGQFFHSKHFPSLRYFIQTGFDTEIGCLTYKSIFLNSPVKEVDLITKSLSDSSPSYFTITSGGDGISKSKEYSLGELINLPNFNFVKNIIEKKHFEC